MTIGGSKIDGIFDDEAELITQTIPNGRRVELITGERYYTSATDTGDGLLLAGGNYAILIGGSVIKSIQRGSVVMATGQVENITINPVDVGKSTLSITSANGYRIVNNYAASYWAGGFIDSPSSVELTAGDAPGESGADAVIYWTVTEYA